MEITKLEISGFKSIAKVDLSHLEFFNIIAGANGSGKSNIFDALRFVSLCIANGLNNTLSAFGGYEYIHCFRLRKESARTFKFLIQVKESNLCYEYSFVVKNMDTAPHMVEAVKIESHMFCERKEDGQVFLYNYKNSNFSNPEKTPINYPSHLPIINIAHDVPIYNLLSNVRLYRIDPVAAKASSLLGWNRDSLDVNGQNIAKVLAELEKDPSFCENLSEFMPLVVPGLTKVSTEQQEIEIRTLLTFKEKGLKKRFPAHLVSDGTIFLLCLFTAVSDPRCQNGIVLIEEPERGINPKAIEELISFFRERASDKLFILVTTHNETVVRSAKADELIFVEKMNGRTSIKWGKEYVNYVKNVPLDTAWLSNMFGSGLPW